MSHKAVLAGRSYLLVEDEYLTASSLVLALEAVGAKVLGPVSNLDRAMEISQDPSFAVDAVILDVKLGGDMVYPFAETLVKRNVPFVFLTGYDCRSMPDHFRSAPCLTKPCDERQLTRLLAGMRPREGMARPG
jgi:two-component SAPR family response regulator